MASSIGEITFLRMGGPQLPKLADDVQILDRLGLDGTGERNLAKKAPGTWKRTREGVANLDSLNDAVERYAALKGTRVTVEDDQGRTVANVLVVGVTVTNVQRLLVSSPAGIYGYVDAYWSLQPTQG